MASLSFRSLVGHNLYASLQVDCAHVEDVTKTKTIFEFVCPLNMKIVGFNKVIGNSKHPCGWELRYDYKPDAQRNCDEANAKKAFQEILQFLHFSNVTVNEYDKHIIGMPLHYRVQYNVDSCICPRVDFDLCNSILKLNVEN